MLPRIWKQRREYKPGQSLYARRILTFGTSTVQRGEIIPAALIRSKTKHRSLWRSGHAGHEPRNAYERKPYGVPAPAEPIAVAPQPIVLDHGNGQRETLTMTPGPTVHVETPRHKQHKRR